MKKELTIDFELYQEELNEEYFKGRNECFQEICRILKEEIIGDSNPVVEMLERKFFAPE